MSAGSVCRPLAGKQRRCGRLRPWRSVRRRGESGDRLGDVPGNLRGRSGPATRARRGADVETETTLAFGRRDRRRTVSLRLHRRGCLPWTPRHRRQGRDGTQGLPGLPGQPGQQSRNPRRLRALRAEDVQGARALWSRCHAVVQTAAGGRMSSRTHPSAHPRGRGGRPADQDPRQGGSWRAGGKAGDLFVGST